MIILICILFNINLFGQKVGVVLSGGGATGFAHIGVLKALEENDIPIDYITGTSAGALIGGLYASGFSPQEIEEIALSESFEVIANNDIESEFKYYIEEQNEDAGLFSVRLSKDSVLKKSLPTNLLNPTFLDLKLMHLLGTNPANTLQTFDSLFVPFRCVASDIVQKKSVTFKSGPLSQAVRASMTYPFFISPIKIDGKLMFDGGMYNNFPAENMYSEFNADFIIGSNVSYNEPPPNEDDLMSQVSNMFTSHSNYSLPCEQGIIIEPNIEEVGTFEFDEIKDAIQRGYEATIAKIDSIKMYVNLRVSASEREKQRVLYKAKRLEVNVTEVNVQGVKKEQAKYIENKILRKRKKSQIDYSMLKKRYLNLYQSEHIRSLYPTLYPLTDTTQKLDIVVKREKPFKASFGGHYSSRPVNTGFLSASYSDFQITPVTVYANTYFGKFYGSVKAGLKFHMPTKSISYIEPMFVMNRWDYFRSFATFFEDVKPSYIVQNERFWSLQYHLATSSKSKMTFDFSNGRTEDNYYQTDLFTNSDTADYTNFLFYSPGFSFSMSSLNRKQFASAGYSLNVSSRYVHGIERTTPGSTSQNMLANEVARDWFYAKVSYTNYFMRRGVFRLGMLLEGVYSNQPYFHNYRASLLSAHAFLPIPDANLAFYDDFRANQYLGGGLMNVFTIKDFVDFRLEAYYFQPIVRILENNGSAYDGELFADRFGIGSASIIYHSPIGPLRATVNYFGSQSIVNRLSVQVSFGYVIFNRRGLK
ncbi:patatin-like phospholipase family protein [Paracrocinitomix mangrovi]|uniref:patatin-like phospholipase family protein n=1 Tax=Paracrocinitomix mangrovi TaxID=2862509 RepID=UPI001C8E4420|nr:patatin-like phospholipase family protein [Paracrocinitomix mangrovi]UKN01955.1 patatin-like phospholipase family protein [Paracrocinitomix mangrovi]